ncbi:Protein phosphatase 2C 2 [Kappamyces sp. JEL0829]|nr:Protein phosphatase 2C 2 [Kappamyces sp. JEL0829]
MEDAHTTILKLDDKGTGKHLSLFAVYDGHGGSHAAKYAGSNLYENVVNTEEYAQGNYREALKKGFHITDDKLRADPQHEREPSGCTAVVTLVSDDNTIYCANAGDSRAVLSDSGVAEPLSFDHKPVNQTEYNRINAAGGFVEFGRVNGNLALSRAIGDFEFKNNTSLPAEEQVVTCDPEITEHLHKDSHEFFVVACDGIWDVLSSQQVIDFVSLRISQGLSLSEICEAMTENCLAKDAMVGIGCDNMTVVICAILNGQTQEEWNQKVTDRYLAGRKEETSAEESSPEGPSM